MIDNVEFEEREERDLKYDAAGVPNSLGILSPFVRLIILSIDVIAPTIRVPLRWDRMSQVSPRVYVRAFLGNVLNLSYYSRCLLFDNNSQFRPILSNP